MEVSALGEEDGGQAAAPVLGDVRPQAGRLEDDQKLFARGLIVPFAIGLDDGQKIVDRPLEVAGRALGFGQIEARLMIVRIGRDLGFQLGRHGCQQTVGRGLQLLKLLATVVTCECAEAQKTRFKLKLNIFCFFFFATINIINFSLHHQPGFNMSELMLSFTFGSAFVFIHQRWLRRDFNPWEEMPRARFFFFFLFLMSPSFYIFMKAPW